MLVSHRAHRLPLGASALTVDRAIATTLLLKRATVRELVQDERITKPSLGRDCTRERHRLAIGLDGALQDFLEQRTSLPVTAGVAVFVPAGAPFATRGGDCDVLELEWDPGSLDDGSASMSSAGAATFRLGPRTFARARELGARLRSATDGEAVLPPFRELLVALRAEGCPMSPDLLHDPATSRLDQAVMDHIDAALNQLGEGPMMVDLETSMTAARRTLTRRIRSVHERHGLLGRGAGRWRGIRDMYRLVIASVLLSHREATPQRVAGLVGYGSAEALHHAFRRASLPTPGALRRAVLDGA